MDLNVLERILLDENAEPMNLTLSLLEDITNSFSPDHQIGSGGFEVVYKGTVGKLRVAVKKLTRTHQLPESKFHKEVECLMKARHMNIVRFLGYCAETQGKAEDCEGRFVMADMRNWLLCFEYVPNGSLEKYIKDASEGLEWRVRFRIIKGICHGLHYLHKKHILHLDLKPANILLNDHMEPKIADFGLSRCLGEEQTHATTKHLSGTPGYLAPEFFRRKVSFASDIYSLGVIIMEILTGAKGYPEDENVSESWMNRLEGDMQVEQVRLCTKIGGIECMELDTKKRPVAWRIVDMLDKTTCDDETGMSSSLVVPQVSLLKEQSHQESIGRPAGILCQEGTKEHPKTEAVAEHIRNDYSQQGEENAWEGQDTNKENVNNHGTSIFKKKSSHEDSNFVRNGGWILKNVRGLWINFTGEEIKEITRYNSKSRNPYGVCNGTLADNTMVAVKSFMVVNIAMEQNDIDTAEVFVKVVDIHTQMIHKNILRLVGRCCLETEFPISVHEYAANGSLLDILHCSENKNLPLDLRLDIAIGSAEGLRHMHAGEIRHGNIQPGHSGSIISCIMQPIHAKS